MGSGVCTAGTPEKAFACAREKCIREGGPYLRECTVTRFFDPDGKQLEPMAQ